MTRSNLRLTKPGQKSSSDNNFEEPPRETQDLLIKNKYFDNLQVKSKKKYNAIILAIYDYKN